MDSHPEIEREDDPQLPEVIRLEVSFLNLPFFALWDKDVSRRQKIEYTASVSRDRERLEISWKVTSNPEYGYPGPFDRKLHRAMWRNSR